MALVIGMVSQKGGVGKSTLARLVAREMAANGWKVKIADLDIQQASSFRWRARRLEAGIEPDVSVEQFGRVEQALKMGGQYDLLVLDGAPHATAGTRQIAEASDLVVIPTGLSVDDLEPGVMLGNELVQHVPRKRVVFALCRVGPSEGEVAEARDYITQAGFEVFKGELAEKIGYRRASDEGRAVSETRFETLKERAEGLAQSVVNKLVELTKK